MRIPRRRARLLGSALLVISALGTGCAAETGGPGAGGGEEPPENRALVERLYEGTMTAPPKEGPKAQRDKNVWIISCGQASSVCAVPVAAMQEAGEAMGWDITVFDGQLNPAKYAEGLNQAIASGADGILFNSIDCSTAVAPFKEAKKQGIKVSGIFSFDCNDGADGEQLFSTWTKFGEAESVADIMRAWGAAKAAWVIHDSGGSAKVIDSTVPGFRTPSLQSEGVRAQLDTCSGCEVTDEVEIAIAGLSNGAAQTQLTTALQQHPDAGYFIAFTDTAFGQFANAAIRSAARDDMRAIGGGCFPENLTAIAEGGPQKACVMLDQEWYGWAAVDALNRVFADPESKPVDQGLGFQLVDKEHNLTEDGTWESPVDFKAAYRKVWGVS